MKIAIAKYTADTYSQSCHRTSDGYMYKIFYENSYRVFTIGDISEENKYKIKEYEEKHKSETFDETPYRENDCTTYTYDKNETILKSIEWKCGVIGEDDCIDEIRLGGTEVKAGFNVVLYDNLYSLGQYGYRSCLNGLYGLIKNGQIVLPCIYKSILWYEGFEMRDKLKLTFSTKYGDFISSLNDDLYFNSTTITTSDIDALLTSNNGYNLCVKSGKFGVIDNKGSIILPFTETYIELGDKHIYYEINENGKRPVLYNNRNRSSFVFERISILSSALLLFDIWDERQNHAVYSLKEDKLITQYEYDSVCANENANYIIVKKNYKKGLINYAGCIVIDCLFDNIDLQYVLFGYIVVELNNLKGLFSTNNTLYIPCLYDHIICLNKNTFILNKGGKKHNNSIVYGINSLYNLEYGNKDLLQDIDNEFISWETEGMLKYGKRQNNIPNFGIINYEGEVLLDCIYTSIKVLNNSRLIFKVSDDRNKTYYLIKNNIRISQKYNIIFPIKDNICVVYNGLVKVYNKRITPIPGEGYCGIIDTDGNILEDLKHLSISPCNSDNKCIIQSTDRKMFLWKEGKQISKKYDIIYQESENIMIVYNGIYIVKNGKKTPMKYGLWGTIDINGNEIIPLTDKYDAICGQYSCGLARVKINGLYGYIDTKGNLIIQCIYNKGNNFINNVARVEKDNKILEIDKNGFITDNVGIANTVSHEPYSEDELNDMYKDALDGNPHIWHWNID
jgi:hypothetical protein